MTEVLLRARNILWDQPHCSMLLGKFKEIYIQRFEQMPSVDVIKKDLNEVLVVSILITHLT